MLKKLEKIEEMLKEDFKIKEEGIEIKLEENKYEDDEIVIKLGDSKYFVAIEDKNISLADLVYKIIQEIYFVDINSRKRYIKETKNFLYRKTKSISIWQQKLNEGKVAEIVGDMTRRVQKDQKCKNEIYEYKELISVLYNVKNILEQEGAAI